MQIHVRSGRYPGKEGQKSGWASMDGFQYVPRVLSEHMALPDWWLAEWQECLSIWDKHWDSLHWYVNTKCTNPVGLACNLLTLSYWYSHGAKRVLFAYRIFHSFKIIEARLDQSLGNRKQQNVCDLHDWKNRSSRWYYSCEQSCTARNLWEEYLSLFLLHIDCVPLKVTPYEYCIKTVGWLNLQVRPLTICFCRSTGCNAEAKSDPHWWVCAWQSC